MTLFDRPFAHFVLAGMIVALALAGCGRKGPLDPPPAAAAPTAHAVPAGPNPTAANEPMAPNGRLTVPKGPDKHIFLDDILN
jgi:predicted small lipoprotein YifL